MKLFQLQELKILLSVSSIDKCLVCETKEGAWTFVLYVRNHISDTVSECSLLSQRGRKREWNDPRAMFRFIKVARKTWPFRARMDSADGVAVLAA